MVKLFQEKVEIKNKVAQVIRHKEKKVISLHVEGKGIVAHITIARKLVEDEDYLDKLHKGKTLTLQLKA